MKKVYLIIIAVILLLVTIGFALADDFVEDDDIVINTFKSDEKTFHMIINNYSETLDVSVNEGLVSFSKGLIMDNSDFEYLDNNTIITTLNIVTPDDIRLDVYEQIITIEQEGEVLETINVYVIVNNKFFDNTYSFFKTFKYDNPTSYKFFLIFFIFSLITITYLIYKRIKN